MDENTLIRLVNKYKERITELEIQNVSLEMKVEEQAKEIEQLRNGQQPSLPFDIEEKVNGNGLSSDA